MRKLGEYSVLLLSPGEHESEEEKSCNEGLLKFTNRKKCFIILKIFITMDLMVYGILGLDTFLIYMGAY